MNDSQKKRVSIACIVAFILFTLAVFWFVGRPMLAFVSQPDRFRDWVDAHGIWGRLAFVGMVVLQIVVAIIPGEPLEIGAGYAFGILEGTCLCLLGAVIGGTLVVVLVRRYGVKLVEVFFSREKIQSLKFMQDHKRLDILTFFLFMIPGTPKDLLCYFVGLTNIKIKDWVLISLFARIPSIITSTIGGDALGMQQYQFAVIVFAATMVLSIGGILIYHNICKRQNNAAKTETQPSPQEETCVSSEKEREL